MELSSKHQLGLVLQLLRVCLNTTCLLAQERAPLFYSFRQAYPGALAANELLDRQFLAAPLLLARDKGEHFMLGECHQGSPQTRGLHLHVLVRPEIVQHSWSLRGGNEDVNAVQDHAKQTYA